MKTRKRGREDAASLEKPPVKKHATRSSKAAEPPAPKKSVVKKPPPKKGTKRAMTLVVRTPSPAKGRVYREVELPFTRKPAPTLTNDLKKPDKPEKSAPKKPTPLKLVKSKGEISTDTHVIESSEKTDLEKNGNETLETPVEREEEHNYSKDPKGELMKLNLPVYACNVCKRYTFDPQQSSHHARTAHNGKVGIMLMLPLPNIELSKPVPSKKLPVQSPQMSPREEPKPVTLKMPALPNTPSIRMVTSPSKSQAAEPNKAMYNCGKCDRHFERERQMNMHRCLEQSLRKSSPRRGEDGAVPKSPRRATEVAPPKSPRGKDEDMQKTSSEMPASPAKLVIAQKEATSSSEVKENGPEKTGDQIKAVGDSDMAAVEDSDKAAVEESDQAAVEESDQAAVESDDSDDGIPPTLGVHLSKSVPGEDRRGTWKLCKRKDVTGWKWEAQKVPEDEIKQKADDEKENEEEKSKADEIDNESSRLDPVVGDEDDYEFGEDDYAEDDEEDELDPEAITARKPKPSDDADPYSEYSKYKAMFADLEDDMLKQWANKESPTTDEIKKYIKVVHGGLQSGGGQALEFYMCLICRKVFKTKNVMTPHIYGHIGYRPYFCGLCGYSATHFEAWKLHMQKHADNELKCWHGQCTFIGSVKEDLVEHRKTAHVPALPCTLCNVRFKSQSTILGHLYIDHQDEIKEGKGKDFYTKMATAGRSRTQIILFECDICGHKCKTKRGYYSHIKINHAQNKTSKKKEESNVVNRRKGKRGSYAKKPQKILKCPMCVVTCHSENKLNRHLHSHPFIYRCCMCEEKFLTYGALNEHVGFHRAEEEEFNPQEKINESLRRSLYLAGQMDKALEADKVQWAQRRTGAAAPKSAMTGSIFDELMSKISIPTEDANEEDLKELGDAFAGISYKRLTPSILRYIHLRFGNVECGVCGKLFPKVGLCKDHTKMHTKVKDFKCTKCDFQGISKKSLERHLAKAHNEGESFHCPKCDTNIIGADMYKHHMRRHANENTGPFTCTWCNTVEERKEDMKNHIMNTHPMMPLAESTKILGTGVVIHRQKGAPFLVCEVCNETFRRICDLRRHMWKHSSVKRFTCDLCDYGSDKRGNIISHMRRHSTEKQATCHVCGKMYKTMQSLKLHVRSAHLKLKPYKCDYCDYAASQPVHLRRHTVLHHTNGERRKFRCAICPDYKATDLQVVKRHYKKKHPNEKMNISKCCPPEAQNPSAVKKDKHQVIQVVPSLPAQTETPANSETPAPAEPPQEMDQEQLNQSVDMDSAVVEVQTEQQEQQISHDMTVEVVLPEEQGQLIDINSALPDVINALAALQESDLNTQ